MVREKEDGETNSRVAVMQERVKSVEALLAATRAEKDKENKSWREQLKVGDVYHPAMITETRSFGCLHLNWSFVSHVSRFLSLLFIIAYTCIPVNTVSFEDLSSSYSV